MTLSSALRACLIASTALIGGFSFAHADSGSVQLTIYKAGWVIGGSGGNGVMRCGRQSYPITIGPFDPAVIGKASRIAIVTTLANV